MSDQVTLYTNPDTLAIQVGKFLIDAGFMQRQERALWTKTEVAEYLRCTPAHVDMLIKERGFPVVDISNPKSKSRDLRFSSVAVKGWEVEQNQNKK